MTFTYFTSEIIWIIDFELVKLDFNITEETYLL